MITVKNKFQRRQKRVRTHLNKISRSRLRLSVFRSNLHIYAQIIDDSKRVTLISASSIEKSFQERSAKGNDVNAAQIVGRLIAERAVKEGITEVVFDRGGNLYHGRIKALAENARQNGLVF